MTRQIPFGVFSFSVSFCMAHILVTASPHDNQTLNSNRWIDLNSDLGEHDGDGYAADRAMLGVVSSANIACGAHAGSPDVMRQTIRTARSLGVGSVPTRDIPIANGSAGGSHVGIDDK